MTHRLYSERPFAPTARRWRAADDVSRHLGISHKMSRIPKKPSKDMSYPSRHSIVVCYICHEEVFRRRIRDHQRSQACTRVARALAQHGIRAFMRRPTDLDALSMPAEQLVRAALALLRGVEFFELVGIRGQKPHEFWADIQSLSARGVERNENKVPQVLKRRVKPKGKAEAKAEEEEEEEDEDEDEEEEDDSVRSNHGGKRDSDDDDSRFDGDDTVVAAAQAASREWDRVY